MARILGLFPAALIAAGGGLSATQFYNELRDAGQAARKSEVFALYKIAKSITTASATEPFANPGGIPSGRELPVWPTRNATGVRQNVTITYRDRTTGEIKQTYWSTVTPNGITREAAMATAIDAYSEHAESYDQDLIGAVHTSAYSLQPGI